MISIYILILLIFINRFGCIYWGMGANRQLRDSSMLFFILLMLRRSLIVHILFIPSILLFVCLLWYFLTYAFISFLLDESPLQSRPISRVEPSQRRHVVRFVFLIVFIFKMEWFVYFYYRDPAAPDRLREACTLLANFVYSWRIFSTFSNSHSAHLFIFPSLLSFIHY